MSAHRASPDEPWPGWSTSRAAQAAYGKHLVRIGELIPVLLYSNAMERQRLAAAHAARHQDLGVDEVLWSGVCPMAVGFRQDCTAGKGEVGLPATFQGKTSSASQ
ncbi:hypothetical protein ACFYW9_23040 [Streptomyces sp. NPDC002698]|uniref:hypothetical protein n=1 Tax=Streptomyces sp. NPDC002698 TaxID=3364660 RepID=UPI0036A7B71A